MRRVKMMFAALIVIVVIALALVVLPLARGGTTTTSGEPLFRIESSNINIQAGSPGRGFILVAVSNIETTPLTQVVVAKLTPNLPNATKNLGFDYNGSLVSSSNPLPVGARAYATYTFGSGGIAGRNYSAVIEATDLSGATSIETTPVTACTVGTLVPHECVEEFDYTFPIRVDYNGSWRLSYQRIDGGNTGVGLSEGNSTLSGQGPRDLNVTVFGLSTDEMMLCATAQKLDAQNASLALELSSSGDTKQTSIPFGSVGECASASP